MPRPLLLLMVVVPRERTGSVWPALRSHGAAAGATMVVARQLLAG